MGLGADRQPVSHCDNIALSYKFRLTLSRAGNGGKDDENGATTPPPPHNKSESGASHDGTRCRAVPVRGGVGVGVDRGPRCPVRVGPAVNADGGNARGKKNGARGRGTARVPSADGSTARVPTTFFGGAARPGPGRDPSADGAIV